MKSLFEEMGGTYRQEGDYLIPNLALPDEPEYQIGKYGRMRRSYLKEHRPVLYASLLTSGTLHRHLAEIDQACNERMEIIVSAYGKAGRCDRSPESRRPNGMGAPHEQHPQPCGGNRSDRACI